MIFLLTKNEDKRPGVSPDEQVGGVPGITETPGGTPGMGVEGL